MLRGHEVGRARGPLLRDPRVRSIIIQVAFCVLAAAVIGLLGYAASQNLARRHLATGFGFWNVTAGFDISQTLIDYSSSSSTYGRAFWVGLLNTLLVAAIGIVLATVLGFTIGIARLSGNWLVARLAGGYVQLVRNIPLLLQLLFWYNAVLKALPDFHSSLRLPGGGFLNNHGLFLPSPQVGDGGHVVLAALFAAIAGAVALAALARGGRLGARPALVGGVALVLGLPAAAFVASGASLGFVYPQMSRYNLEGGIEILPELVALVLGLVIYTASFIAEAVRAGILAVPRGQTEAALALGLTRMATLRFVIVPQAMRVIIPPLTNQYLNLTKNSSLAVAIGYPDLVQIFTGTVLNQTSQPVEIVAITMAVYLAISLVTSFLMNLYNARMALRER
ncbi:MAG TPA: ABC transporter permease subunit [Xanthobacteraceae bacterium]